MSKHVDVFTKSHLQPGETIAASADGACASFDGYPRGACIVTTSRVVLFRKGMFGEAMQSAPIAAITTVDHTRTLGWSKLFFRTASEQLEFRTGDKAAIEAIQRAVEAGRRQR